MKLAIADPPYLGRADRWYGNGRGHGRGRGVADPHPEARTWDHAATHEDLVERLVDDYDGYAIAATPSSLPLYLTSTPPGTRVAMWIRDNAMPTGSRIRALWEPVLVYVPETRRAHHTGPLVDDTLICPISPRGFVGSKPPEWTHWALSLLGYDPDIDEVDDIFPGSGAVTAAIATYSPPVVQGRRKSPSPDMARRLRSAARGTRNRRAAALAALRAGASIRSVAQDVGVSPTTVQKWKRTAITTLQGLENCE